MCHCVHYLLKNYGKTVCTDKCTSCIYVMREGLHVHMYITSFGSAVITMATNGIHQEEENIPNTRGQCKHMYMYMYMYMYM